MCKAVPYFLWLHTFGVRKCMRMQNTKFRVLICSEAGGLEMETRQGFPFN